MKIYLLRHGLQENNLVFNPKMGRPDPELSSLGQRQADLLGCRLAKHNISAIYASDMQRAVQTAEMINNHLGVTLEWKFGLREIDMGEVSITEWDQIAVEPPDFSQSFQQHSFDIA